MPGNPPVPALTPDKPSYTDGDPMRVAVTVSDADNTVEKIHGGPDALGRADDITIVRTDTARITAAYWAGTGEKLAVSGLTVSGPARYGAGQLVVEVVDAQGNTAKATADPGVQAKTTTMFGVDPSESNATDHAQDIAWFPGAKVGAAYGGTTCPQWADAYVTAMHAAGYRITFSAKSLTLSAFTANWDTMPAPRAGHGLDPFEYIPFHEANRPSGGPVLSTWLAFWTALVKARDAHKNRDRILLGPNFSWWPAAIAKNEGTPWQKFVLSGANFISWDQYWGGGMTGITTVDQFTALPWQSGQDYGLPVNIREFGVSGSQADATAAKVIADVAPVYRAKKFVHVSQFNFRSGVSGAWLLPTDRPLAFKAWQQVCASQ